MLLTAVVQINIIVKVGIDIEIWDELRLGTRFVLEATDCEM